MKVFDITTISSTWYGNIRIIAREKERTVQGKSQRVRMFARVVG